MQSSLGPSHRPVSGSPPRVSAIIAAEGQSLATMIIEASVDPLMNGEGISIGGWWAKPMAILWGKTVYFGGFEWNQLLGYPWKIVTS